MIIKNAANQRLRFFIHILNRKKIEYSKNEPYLNIYDH